MADKSHIEWTDATWNPTVGCTKVSPGCDNCYAEKDVNRRHAAALSPKTSPRMLEAFPARFDVVSTRPDRFLDLPVTWREPRKVFVNSLSDLFHADIPDRFIAQVFAVMAATPRHTYQLLTKRHARMRSLVTRPAFAQRVGELALAYGVDLFRDDPVEPGDPRMRQAAWPLPNVWLGVSVEDQHWADIRIPALLETPAAVRWISAEPLLGPVNLHLLCSHSELSGQQLNDGGAEARYVVRFPCLDWVVAGGESGGRARPMHPGWALDLRDQCDRAAVAFLFKQWGNWLPVPADEGRRGDLWLFGDGIGKQPWDQGQAGARPGRWDPYGDVLMRNVGKTAAGRELDGRTHDGYPATAPVPA